MWEEESFSGKQLFLVAELNLVFLLLQIPEEHDLESQIRKEREWRFLRNARVRKQAQQLIQKGAGRRGAQGGVVGRGGRDAGGEGRGVGRGGKALPGCPPAKRQAPPTSVLSGLTFPKGKEPALPGPWGPRLGKALCLFPEDR